MGRRSDPGWRDRDAAALAAQVLSELPPPGPVLVVDDSEPTVPAAVAAMGTPVQRWDRVDRPAGGAQAVGAIGADGASGADGADGADGAIGAVSGQTWPPAGPFGAALLRLPRSKDALEFALHAAASVVRSGGLLWVYGAKDEGIASAARPMEALLGPVTTLATAKRCRVLAVERPERVQGLRGELGLWRRRVDFDLGWGPVDWVTYPGTFAGQGLDPGTALLLEHLGAEGWPRGGVVVDFAAGTGVLSAAAARARPDVRLVMIEPDALARAAARVNVPGADLQGVGGWEAVGPADAIVSNPPYHRGKAEDLSVIQGLLERAPRVLTARGELRMVVQRRLPVEPLMRAAFDTVEILADRGPFRVWRGRAPRSPSRVGGP